MTVKDVKIKAREMGLQLGSKMKKTNMIRSIQVAEGNSPCFQTGVSSCGQENCCWRSDCM